MHEAAPRFLFVPVSGRSGMGEYARSRALARAALVRWPDAQVHFLLSREAPYAADREFASTLLPSSPTHHSAAVIDAIARFRPQVVIFDNAGRTAQLEAAFRAGAGLVYISARARQRRKAFRWRWMGMIDEHWIAYPQLLAGGLSLVERLKLRLRRGPVVRYLDVLLSADDPDRAQEFLRQHQLEAQAYVLLAPGAASTHAGAASANEVFARVAAALATRSVLIAPTDSGMAPTSHGSTLRLARQDAATLHALMRRARLVITNGGGTLLQALACGAPTLAVPIAKDQDARIRRCVALGLTLRAELNAAGIAAAAQSLLDDDAARQVLQVRVRSFALRDGTAMAVNALESILNSKQAQAAASIR